MSTKHAPSITVLILVLIVLMGIGIYLIGFRNSPIANISEHPLMEVTGNKDDLVSFSIAPGAYVHGVVSFTGSIKGGYFQEGSMPVSILDTNKNVLKTNGVMATGEWMTADAVPFAGSIDTTGLPVGPAYIRLMQDDLSGGANGFVPKSILIPVVID